jgi:hypothetical protein
MTMVSAINPNDPPSFVPLGERAFEELCRDLFEREAGIRTCEKYGVRGESQLGIDLIAQALDVSNSEVGQCKCCATFLPFQVRKASDEFLRNLKYWRERRVKRFILFVASSLDKKNQQDEINKQVKRFADVGLIYEAWSARTLRTKLRPHPDLVRRYTGSEEWVKNICGSAVKGDGTNNEWASSGRQFGYDRRAVENEIQDLSRFKKLFGFEAKLPMRNAVVSFYKASQNISRINHKCGRGVCAVDGRHNKGSH